MKSNRVWASTLAVAAVVLAFFLLPLPVSRVRETGMVQLHPEAVEKVYVPNLPGSGLILDRLRVRDGERVEKGQVLAEFRSLDIENQLDQARGQAQIYKVQMMSLHDQKVASTNLQERARIEGAAATAAGNLARIQEQLRGWEMSKAMLVLRAPRAGVVMTSPKVDEVGKLWEKDQAVPFCGVGDPARMQVLLPVTPADHRLLKDELAYYRGKNKDVPVTVRIMGNADETWKGKVALMQESEAKDVPPQLTTKYGGPLAVKPLPDQNTYVPQSQHYLVSIDLLKTDSSMHPGTLAKVKIHCQWRSCAWWVWRAISSTFDLGLI